MSSPPSDNRFITVVNLLIRLTALVLLIGWCVYLILPFIDLFLWGGLIAISLFPLHERLRRWVGKSWISAALLTVGLLGIISFSGWLIGDSLYEGVSKFSVLIEQGIPMPEEWFSNWPDLAARVHELTVFVQQNLGETLSKSSPFLTDAGKWLLQLLREVGWGITELLISTLLAGFLIHFGGRLERVIQKLFHKLGGTNGDQLYTSTVQTTRIVIKGILLVSIIQSGIASIGLFAAGIPYAGLWSLCCVVCAIAQLGVLPVALPAMVYAFYTFDSVPALLFTGWMVIAMATDNILKPFLLGKGAPVPMLVVFLGSIGGFIMSGFTGLFTGAVVLSLGFHLFMQWIDDATPQG